MAYRMNLTECDSLRMVEVLKNSPAPNERLSRAARELRRPGPGSCQ